MRLCATSVLSALAFAAGPVFAQPGVVHGQVTESGNGKPISKVTVTLRSERRPSPEIDAYSSVTDAQGRYRIANLPAGLYSVEFKRLGFVWPVSKNGDSNPLPDIGLHAAEDRTLDLHLTPAGVISGRILNEDGDPVRDIEVQLQWWDELDKTINTRKHARSDDRGEYRFYNIPPGSYYIKAIPNAGLPEIYTYENVRGMRPQVLVATYLPGVRDRTRASDLKLEPGAEISQADVRLIAEKLYAVRVNFSSGPPNGTSFGISLETAGTATLASPTTRSYLFHVAGSGAYSLVGLRSRGMWQQGGVDGYFQEKVQVVDRDVEVDAPSFLPTLHITGKLEADGPVSFSLRSLDISLQHDGSSPLPWSGKMVRPAEDGSLAMMDLVPDSYTLDLHRDDAYIKSVRVGEQIFAGSQFRVTGDSAITILLATDGGRVQGVVEAAGDNDSTGSSVMLFAGGKLVRLTRTDTDGHFDFENVPPGDYRLYAWRNSDFFRDADFAKKFEDQSAAVTVEPHGKHAVALRVIVER